MQSGDASKQTEPIIEPCGDLRYPEDTAACRRQLDRQRDAVEARANSRHSGCNGIGQ